MAIIVNTNNPEHMLSKIKEAIDNGKIDTWNYDADGDFTHTPKQWIDTAWLRPVVASGSLIFGLIGKRNDQMTKVIYAVYHGRFVEMLLTHFDDDFSAANTTSKKYTGADIFK